MSRLCQIVGIVLEGLIGATFVYSFAATGRKFELLLGVVWTLLCISHVIPEILNRKIHK